MGQSGVAVRRAKAKGLRGDWFATVEGERLPCIHQHWYRFPERRYHDPQARPGERKWDELITALREKGKAVMTRDTVKGDGENFKRRDYIAVFTIANVDVDEVGLKFDITERVLNL